MTPSIPEDQQVEAKAIRACVVVSREVEIAISDPDVIERVTGPKGDEWRAQVYNLHTRDDVLEHLAYNCAANGAENARLLDGWADLPAEAVSMRLRGDSDAEVIYCEQVCTVCGGPLEGALGPECD